MPELCRSNVGVSALRTLADTWRTVRLQMRGRGHPVSPENLEKPDHGMDLAGSLWRLERIGRPSGEDTGGNNGPPWSSPWKTMVRGRPLQAPCSLGSALNSVLHSGHSHSVLVILFVLKCWPRQVHHSPLCCGAELQGPAKFVGGPRADHSALTWSRYLGWESLTPLNPKGSAPPGLFRC